MRTLLIGILIYLAQGNKFTHFLQEEPALTQRSATFDQIIDHFSYDVNRKWKQRYFILDDHFDPQTGGVILYICGEWVCNGVGANSQAAQLAK